MPTLRLYGGSVYSCAIFFKAQNKIQDPAKLARLVQMIDAESWVGMDADTKGDLYEGLLQKNAEDTKSGAGQYFTPRQLVKMDPEDRLRAVYLHACLRYVERDFMTNTTLRGRFGLDVKNSAAASRLLKDALVAKVIRLHDPEAPPKYRKYVPWWA